MIRTKIKDIFDNFRLGKEQEEYDIVHSEIEKAVVFRGTNLIILICAILVASVGLNMNSPAVIIGAMLISPLMGPINAMGYSIATYDFELFKLAVRNLTFAVVVSLLTSALYFFISPVNTAHSELLARTSPTIYDVLVAIFGGIAGMLAINSKLKGNVIPGVAIATALMPPICTAGYGVATLHFDYFFGALYLFTINTVFIGVSAMIISQILKFPIRTIIDPDKIKRVNSIITIILIAVTVPSAIFGYRLVKNEQFKSNANNLIKEVSVQSHSYLIDHTINPQKNFIRLVYSGYGVSNEEKTDILEKAFTHHIDTSNIEIINGTDVKILEDQKEKMEKKIASETDILSNQLATASFSLQKAEAQLDSLKSRHLLGKKILSEITKLYPQIKYCSYSESCIYPDTLLQPIVVFECKKTIWRRDRAKIKEWVKERTKNKKTIVYFNIAGNR